MRLSIFKLVSLSEIHDKLCRQRKSSQVLTKKNLLSVKPSIMSTTCKMNMSVADNQLPQKAVGSDAMSQTQSLLVLECSYHAWHRRPSCIYLQPAVDPDRCDNIGKWQMFSTSINVIILKMRCGRSVITENCIAHGSWWSDHIAMPCVAALMLMQDEAKYRTHMVKVCDTDC